MKLRDFLDYHVETIGPDDSLQKAAQKMRDLDVGSLPVCTDSQLIGMVTDRDITIRATADGDDPVSTKVSEVMTPDVIACYEHQSVEEAAHLMEQHQVRRLFILNEHDELVAVASLGELATATGDSQMAGRTLERISHSAEAVQEQEADFANQESDETEATSQVETRVSGLFDDSEQAKEAVEELKDAGFTDDRIAVAMQE